MAKFNYNYDKGGTRITMKQEKIIVILILVLVPSISFGSIYFYKHYQELKELRVYQKGWSLYNNIKMDEIPEPQNITQTMSAGIGKWSKQDYPILIHTSYFTKQDDTISLGRTQVVYIVSGYNQFTFLMPWGETETIWVECPS